MLETEAQSRVGRVRRNLRGLRWNLKSEESKTQKQTTRNYCGLLKTGKTVGEWVGPLGVILYTQSCQLQGFIQLCVKHLMRILQAIRPGTESFTVLFFFFPLYDSSFIMTVFCPKSPFHPFLLTARSKNKFPLDIFSIF